MEKLIEGALAEALKRNRDRFNTKYALARRSVPALLPEAFAEHLRSTVSPIADVVGSHFVDCVDAVVDALYDLSLELVGKGFLGEQTRYPALLDGWRKLLVAVPHFLVSDPALVCGSVSNALYNLSTTAGARPGEWIKGMIQMGWICSDAASFLEAGKVIAWRSGMAHYREGALEACRKLDPDVARAALGVMDVKSAAPIDVILDRMARDPWQHPATVDHGMGRKKVLKIVSRAGAFRGFGGLFPAPPRVAVRGGEFLVFDNETWWTLTADLFGSTLHRVGPKIPGLKNEINPAFKIDSSGRVLKESEGARFPALSKSSSSASNETTLAVTVPLSHSVYLVAMVEDFQ
ncbi:MAG: hypothetical protein L0229_06770 [Blastocatellia bacterium]|nr:hypothetical protein [Blastocatellia bacterium]